MNPTAVKSTPKNILIALTGGTICSFANANGEQRADTERAQTLIVQKFRDGDSPYRGEDTVVFDTKSPLDILSENMTVAHWQTLVRSLREYDLSRYDGVIVLHGTDTLAYTASLLALLLAGTPVPVFLVSSQLPLYEDAANGNDNFRTAVEQIVDGIQPNVYVAYRNDEPVDGGTASTMYIHYAAHLLQCPNHSNNFTSADMQAITPHAAFGGKATPARPMLLYDCGELKNCVLNVTPYVGIDYSRFSLDGVRVVLHHTYHSGTMAVNPYHPRPRAEEEQHLDCTKDSVMYLKSLCDKAAPAVELYIEPCDKDAAYLYETTGIVLRGGVGTAWRTTSEMAYVKLLVGCALGYEGAALQRFMDEEIGGEFIR